MSEHLSDIFRNERETTESISAFIETTHTSSIDFAKRFFPYRHITRCRTQLLKSKKELIWHAHKLSDKLAAFLPDEFQTITLCKEAYEIVNILDWLLREEDDLDGKRTLENLMENSLKVVPPIPLKAHLLLERMRIWGSDHTITKKQQENLLYEAGTLFLLNKESILGWRCILLALLTKLSVL